MDQPPSSKDSDSRGVDSWRPHRGMLAVALIVSVVVGVGAGSMPYWLSIRADERGATGTQSTQAAPAGHSTSPPTLAAPAIPKPTHAPEGDADLSRDLKSYVVRGERPSMPEVIERLHERGVYSGLGAFSPPGTRPPLVGLAVPDDFELPEGYVRHHQATDDGQRIEAILMFAPNFQLYDTKHQPIDMPQDRIVPAALAPAGLPIRRIVIPPPHEPTELGR